MFRHRWFVEGMPDYHPLDVSSVLRLTNEEQTLLQLDAGSIFRSTFQVTILLRSYPLLFCTPKLPSSLTVR